MRLLTLLLAAAAVTAALGRVTPAAADAAPVRPNFLFIVTDDQRYDTLTDEFMPKTKALVADQGIACTRAYVTTAICSPSRGSILTGRYAQSHGAHDNRRMPAGTTFVQLLHAAGWRTGLVGKYLNAWNGSPRPEFDVWRAWIRGTTDATMNVDGQVRTVPGYQTDVLREYAMRFLRDPSSDRPFCLLFAPHSPHAPAIPAPRDEDAYADLPDWRPPSFNPAAMRGAPRWLQRIPLMSGKRVRTAVDDVRRRQLQCLRSVDDAIGDIVGLLRDQGRLDDTFIVFLSDNGYFWGEHRLAHTKNRVYEEASRVPFAIRYPPLVPAARTETRLVANIDLAPTVCDLAGIAIPPETGGRSLVPLLASTSAPWRDALILEGWPPKGPSYRALHTERMVFVENEHDLPELYDLETDPYQMHNLAGERRHAAEVEEFRARLRIGAL